MPAQCLIVLFYFLLFAFLFVGIEFCLFRLGVRRIGWLILVAGIAWVAYDRLLSMTSLAIRYPAAMDFLRQRHQTWTDALMYSLLFAGTFALINWLTEKVIPDSPWNWSNRRRKSVAANQSGFSHADLP